MKPAINILKKTYCFLRHALEEHEGLRYIVSLLLNWTIILSFYHLCAFLVISVLPVSYYFHYYSVEPLKHEYADWEKITFVSNAVYNKPVFIEWRDILRCPPLDFYSVAITSIHKDKSETLNGQWRYPWDTPPAPSECVMESQITATVDYWIKKTQTIFSQPFIIK